MGITTLQKIDSQLSQLAGWLWPIKPYIVKIGLLHWLIAQTLARVPISIWRCSLITPKIGRMKLWRSLIHDPLDDAIVDNLEVALQKIDADSKKITIYTKSVMEGLFVAALTNRLAGPTTIDGSLYGKIFHTPYWLYIFKINGIYTATPLHRQHQKQDYLSEITVKLSNPPQSQPETNEAILYAQVNFFWDQPDHYSFSV